MRAALKIIHPFDSMGHFGFLCRRVTIGNKLSLETKPIYRTIHEWVEAEMDPNSLTGHIRRESMARSVERITALSEVIASDQLGVEPLGGCKTLQDVFDEGAAAGASLHQLQHEYEATRKTLEVLDPIAAGLHQKARHVWLEVEKLKGQNSLLYRDIFYYMFMFNDSEAQRWLKRNMKKSA
jgi:hypothetical protein